MTFKLALAQIDPVLGDIRKNVEKHLEYCQRAKDAGASLVVFPELSLTGYTIKDMNWELAINPARETTALSPLLEMSRTISIIAGGVEESNSFAIYNSAFLLEDGAVQSVHRKTYPPTYGMFEEMRYFNRGRSVRAFNSNNGRIGVLICEDLWHPSLPYILAQDGADLIITLVASPTRLGGDARELQTARVNSENHKAYARLLTTYLAFCNRTGYEDGINFWGGSSVVGPDGEVDVQAKFFDEDLIVSTIDGNAIRRARRFSRHFLDDEIELAISELTRIHSKS
ncbi:MAG: acyltransferase [Bacteroidetes bacterium]|nr:acyltransferase [Bacteroidota bacterium]MCW5896281.1 acyltransferase [Bacteroidota bacterium]